MNFILSLIQQDEIRNCNEETENDKNEAEKNKESQEDSDEINETTKDELGNDENENIEKVDIGNQDVRRSNRIRKQRIDIHPDEIGECEDEKDEDYR